MSVLVTYSKSPVLLDTVPAVKITNFNGVLKRDNIYSYAKVYILNGNLQLGFSVFDKTPPSTQRVGAAFNFAPKICGDYIFTSTAANGKTECYLQYAGGKSEYLDTLPTLTSAGQDEQGFYWSCEFALPEELIKKIYGTSVGVNDIFLGNMFLYDINEASFGSAFKVELGSTVPTANGFGEFVCVPY